MSEERPEAARVLRVIAERLDAWLDGDERAFESLGERLEESGASGEDLQAALIALGGMAGDAPEQGTELGEPGEAAQRVLSQEERGSLSPEAWGALLGLRRRGALSPSQFERVLGMLGGAGERPVGVDLAIEIASRVALAGGQDPDTETSHDGLDVSH